MDIHPPSEAPDCDKDLIVYTRSKYGNRVYSEKAITIRNISDIETAIKEIL